MKALVVYESMFGNTRKVAEAIGGGLASWAEVQVVPVSEAGAAQVAAADLLVVGGPTHIHGMSRPRTRDAAADMAADPDIGVTLEPHASGPGLREWMAALGSGAAPAAAFDTRMEMAPFFTGRASRRIARLLRRHGHRLVAPPESFIVDKKNHLVAGEEDRAFAWGERVAKAVPVPTART